MFDNVDIQGDQMKLFQQSLTYLIDERCDYPIVCYVQLISWQNILNQNYLLYFSKDKPITFGT